MSSKIGKSGIALQTKSRLHCICDLVGQQYRHPLENVHASEECVGADMLDSVVRVTDHDPAGGAPLPSRTVSGSPPSARMSLRIHFSWPRSSSMYSTRAS